jgi:hypothetical protein
MSALQSFRERYPDTVIQEKVPSIIAEFMFAVLEELDEMGQDMDYLTRQIDSAFEQIAGAEGDIRDLRNDIENLECEV